MNLNGLNLETQSVLHSDNAAHGLPWEHGEVLVDFGTRDLPTVTPSVYIAWEVTDGDELYCFGSNSSSLRIKGGWTRSKGTIPP